MAKSQSLILTDMKTIQDNASETHQSKDIRSAPSKVGGYVEIMDCPKLPAGAVDEYEEFLDDTTPEHIDATGHYKP